MKKEELFCLKPKKINTEFVADAGKRWDSIQKPIDGLGDFEKVISKILAINETLHIENLKKVLVIMCGDHGVVEEGVSQSGQEVTLSVAKVLGENRSTASKLAAFAGVDVVPVDVGINTTEIVNGVRNCKVKCGTNNFSKEPAMTQDETLAAIEVGVMLAKECKEKGYNIIASGEMGIGNTTAGTTMLCALTGVEVSDILGRGAGLSDEGLLRKKHVIETSLIKFGFNHEVCAKVSTEDKREFALNVLSKVGGLELAAMTGLFIGGAAYSIPVMLDGALSAVSALVAEMIIPGCKEYMIASHSGREKSTGYVLNMLGLRPLLNGDMALGEGTGALMTMPLIDMAFDFFNNALSFDDGNVKQYIRHNTK